MRLIDADELKKALAEMWYENNIRITGLSVAELIDNAPTIEPSKSTDQNVADVPSGDLVSRQDAIEAVCGKCSAETRMECALNGYFCCDRRELEALPSADVVSREDYHNLLMASNDIDRALREYQAKEEADADRPTLKQTDTMIIADALRYLIKDTERHELDRTRAEELREQILKYGASMCHSADRPQVNSAEWVAEKEKEFEELNRPKGETEPAPVVAYICDGRRCAICRGPDSGCDHTTDIKHAAHFENVAGQYFERPYMEEETDDGKRISVADQIADRTVGNDRQQHQYHTRGTADT